MKKNVFIIGLGKFGQNLSLILKDSGFDVTVSDIDKNILSDFTSSYHFFNELSFNSANIEALKSTSVKQADYVVVAISKIEDSILTCVNLKDIGVKNIIAKAQNKTHSRILKSIGITDIIFPEEIAATNVATKIINGEIDIIKQNANFSIIKLRVTNDKVSGKLVKEFNNGELCIFAILKNEANATIICSPNNIAIKKLDTLYIMTANENLRKIKKIFLDN